MNYIDMIATYAGRKMQIGDREATIEGPDTKVAVLNDEVGKVPYLRVVSDDSQEQLAIHPAQAQRLMATGSIGAMRIIGDLVEIKAAEPEAVPAPARGEKKTGAIAIFTQDRIAGHTRKQTISRFVAELGMTQAGASTYYQSCKQWVAT